MRSSDLIESFSEFKEFKSMDGATTMKVLEEVFRSMLRKKYESDDHFDVILNTEKGEIEIWRNREIVPDDSENANDPDKITLSEARKIEEDFEVGEEVSEEVQLEDFGRRSILAARQTLLQKIQELEKDNIYRKYIDMVGKVISGEVYQIRRREIIVLDDDGNELVLPKEEQIPSDRYKKGDNLRAVILTVETINSTPRIIISRVANEFLRELFEQEVPEIFDGLITIKRIARLPGERAKVAVESYDDRVDPVGACVGMKGSRIHGIVRELRNESIDVINYTDNDMLLITRSLAPAKVSSISIDEEKKKALVYLKPDQVSLAIGKSGHNIKLACKLTGFDIDVFRETDGNLDDVDLEEFSDEIESWIIDEFKLNGIDTARQALELGVEEMARRIDLEEETAEEIIRILQKEFED